MTQPTFTRPRYPAMLQSKRNCTVLIVGATIINLLIALQGDLALQGHLGQPCQTFSATGAVPPTRAKLRSDETKSTKVTAAVPDNGDACEAEYQRVTAHRTKGLTDEDLKRSWTNRGNRNRLSTLTKSLTDMKQNPRPIKAVVSGGSISVGHGTATGLRYSDRLEAWLNDKFPIPETMGKHQVFNKGSHGSDICAMAKRLTLLVEELPRDIDLFVLEFAVNDYQGQDHNTQLDFKMDVFFEGFDNIAICTEKVVHRLLIQYPTATILFLEMKTAVLGRKTASLLHMGAAQHYQIPVLDYSEAMFPDFQFLLKLIKPFNYTTAIGDTIFPYPHGCHPCVPEHITDAFRPNGCANVCKMQRFDPALGWSECTVAEGREPCMVPFFAHDEVHPSGVGHQIAADLIIEAIASTARDSCKRQRFDLAAVIPRTGWMVSDPTMLEKQNDFVMVNDTYEVFVKKRKLEPTHHSPGFSLYDDRFGRYGWIADTDAGGESITFDIQLPEGGCYIPVLSVVKSYQNMGTFSVTVLDQRSGHSATVEGDALWKPRISVPADVQLLQDGAGVKCTGSCQVTVATHPKKPDRIGNKVKIVTLAVRRCVVTA